MMGDTSMDRHVMGGMTIIRKEGRDARDQLRLHEAGELVWLSAPVLDDESGWLVHGFSTRLGGVSTGEKATMNLTFAREPSAENVRENYRRIARAIGFDPERMVLTHQTHTVNIRVCTEADAGAGYTHERPYEDIDGLITDVPGMTLVCFSADCVPLLAADVKRHVVGCAHSGWRGSAADIGGHLIREMQRVYGSQPEDIRAAIGPSICSDCYEVGAEVAEHFHSDDGEDMQRPGRTVRPGRKDHYQLDLWEVCRRNFMRAGVPEDQITVTDLCTRCNHEWLFSHRAQHGLQGNLGAFIGIRKAT